MLYQRPPKTRTVFPAVTLCLGFWADQSPVGTIPCPGVGGREALVLILDQPSVEDDHLVRWVIRHRRAPARRRFVDRRHRRPLACVPCPCLVRRTPGRLPTEKDKVVVLGVKRE